MKLFLALVAALMVLRQAHTDQRYPNHPLSYADAKAVCEKRDMTLMVIRSDHKMTEVINQMNLDGITSVWLGIRRDDYPINRPWVWKYDSLDNGTVTKEYFRIGQPDNNLKRERCVANILHSGDHSDKNLKRWNDRNCKERHYFYCDRI